MNISFMHTFAFKFTREFVNVHDLTVTNWHSLGARIRCSIISRIERQLRSGKSGRDEPARFLAGL